MKKRMQAGALVLVGALALAACGDSGGSDTAGNTGTTAAAQSQTTAPMQQPATTQMPSAKSDIVDTAVAAGKFTTLVKAVQAAGLVDTLKGPGPFTVFAPTDEAFAKLPAGTLDQLLANPDQLKEVLLYHVVAGKAATASDVTQLSSVSTAAGAPIQIATSGGKVMLNNTAMVVATDVMASNGVIHVIDSVLLPPAR